MNTKLGSRYERSSSTRKDGQRSSMNATKITQLHKEAKKLARKLQVTLDELGYNNPTKARIEKFRRLEAMAYHIHRKLTEL